MWLARIRGRTVARRAAMAALLAGLVLLLSGCSLDPFGSNYPQTTLTPRSDVSNSIQDLFVKTIYWGLIVVVPVEIALIFAALRFRRRPGQVPGPPVGRHGSTRLEIAWTIVPVIILAIIAVPTVQVIFATAAPPPRGSVQVNVTAHQWWWEFTYPHLHIVTANELHLPVGTTANFTLDSADVIHSFWIPAFDGKRDVFPNHQNNMWFKPGVIGVFPGQCAEFCGPAHAFMQMTTVVQSQADFSAWVRQQQRAQSPMPVAAASAMVRHGAQLVTQGSCAGCHYIAGTAAQGKIGPNLTHVGSRLAIGVQQTMPNTTANLSSWIADPSQYKPNALMPAQHLSAGDLRDVVAYLQSLK